MESVSVLSIVAAGVALYTALSHGLIVQLRRQEREHLWLAVTALGVACVSFGIAMLYTSSSVDEALPWQRWIYATATLIMVGFLRFSFCFLRVERPLLDRAALVYAGIIVVLATVTPLIFSGEPVVRRVSSHAHTFVESGLAPVGYLVVAGLLCFFASAVWLHWSRLKEGGGASQLLFGALVLWFIGGVSDGLVVAGVYQAPYMLAFGYSGIVAATSGLLVHRFVGSVSALERFAERLHEMVDERTEELRERELQLAHGEQLAAIGTLAASVAHEINNPIAFVHSNLNQLEELWHKPEAAGDVEEMLAECREGTERVRVIVTELLKLARQSDGRMAPVDLSEVVLSVMPLLGPMARYRATLATELVDLPRLNGDSRLLAQVILNLVVNALDALPEGEAESNRVTVATAYEDGSVWLVVTDTGPGIPEELRPRVFDAFVSTKEEGTGLGLAVTQQIVNRHGGRIELQTDEGGTCMVVEFPHSVLCLPDGTPLREPGV